MFTSGNLSARQPEMWKLALDGRSLMQPPYLVLNHVKSQCPNHLVALNSHLFKTNQQIGIAEELPGLR